MSTDQENELRILLERAVPRLGAPEQRLQQVRERIRRRRRRRTGGALTAALAAVATALAVGLPLHSGPARPTDTVQIPVAQSPTAGADAPPTAPPRVGFPDLAGLSLVLPAHWRHVNTVEQSPKGAIAFVSDQPLKLVQKSCPDGSGEVCPVAVGLSPANRVLLSFQLEYVPGHTKQGITSAQLQKSELEPACRAFGGTSQLSAVLTTASSLPGAVVVVAACLNHATPALTTLVQDIVQSAQFSPAPTSETSQ
ncbi:hypothetical protein [Streptacidiphilus sp. PAMC 29251]